MEHFGEYPKELRQGYCSSTPLTIILSAQTGLGKVGPREDKYSGY